MKRLVLLIFLFSLLSYSYAQPKPPRNDRPNPECFQADLEQFVTEKACLTPQEASEFFPVYAEMFRKQREVRDKMKALKRVKPTTDAECKENITKLDNLEVEMKQIQRAYHEKFMQILPATKVYDVMEAEEQFHRQAFKNMTNDMKRK
ncbi:MAG: hypothetical protein LUD48_06840 [Prevotella sp.]|nr:hypothetical protein [Prevotella sp.]